MRVLFILCVVFHLALAISFQSSGSGSKEKFFTLQLSRRYVPGLVFDYSLCQLFPPPLRDEPEYLVNQFKPKVSSQHVRFIMLHECKAARTVNSRLDYDYRVRQGAMTCDAAAFSKVR